MGSNVENLAKTEEANPTVATDRTAELTTAATEMEFQAGILDSIAQEPGMTGQSADAALEAFHSVSVEFVNFSTGLKEIAAATVTAQSALSAAQGEYAGLPPEGLDQWQAQAVSQGYATGVPVAVPGAGSMPAAQAEMYWVNKRRQEREAQAAVAMADLAADMEAAKLKVDTAFTQNSSDGPDGPGPSRPNLPAPTDPYGGGPRGWGGPPLGNGGTGSNHGGGEGVFAIGTPTGPRGVWMIGEPIDNNNNNNNNNNTNQNNNNTNENTNENTTDNTTENNSGNDDDTTRGGDGNADGDVTGTVRGGHGANGPTFGGGGGLGGALGGGFGGAGGMLAGGVAVGGA
ncbi:hypothetical protein ICW40_12500, partial [Actinotalea ferrariae]|nr:hypothetical protein [Actinotalea ferrariae]